jgi:hypothetical protein
VTGEAVEGVRLVGSPGVWSGSGRVRYAYQWYRCDPMGLHCRRLPGVTRRSHLLGAGDVGYTLDLRVRVRDDTGATGAWSGLVGPIAAAPPRLVSTLQPKASGAVVKGGAVRVDTGDWRPRPSSFSYQWIRCNQAGHVCFPIPGATGERHQIGDDDLGHLLLAIVQARSGTTSEAVLSHLAIAPQKPAPAPARARIKPKPAPPRAAPKPAPARPKPAPPAKRPAARRRAPAPARPARPPAARKPAPAAKAAPPVGAPRPTPAPAGAEGGPIAVSPPLVAEVLQVGEHLTGAIGSWSASARLGFSYRWYRCDAAGTHCSSIRGATKTTYTLVARDAGHTLGFAVVASDAGGMTRGYASLVGPVAPAGAALVSTGQPTISGDPREGQPLQVTTGGWSRPPSAVAYQWQRCNTNGRRCVPIPGATASAYAVTADDAGHTLVALVHATVGAATQDALSPATGTIPGATFPPTSSRAPTVAGTLRQGEQLTGTAGTWSATGALAYAYQWYRCDPTGAHCNSIHGATGATYTQVAADVGKSLGLTVRATNALGTGSGYSSLVGPVAPTTAATVSIVQPTIAGTAEPGQLLQAASGTWSSTPSSLLYQWQRCNANGRLCTPIAHATASTYVVDATADPGHALVVVVQALVNQVTQPVLSAPVLVRT